MELLDFQPNAGLIYNIMKMRAGYLNRLRYVKEEIRINDANQKGRKSRTSVNDDPYNSSLQLVLKVLIQLYYKDNYQIVKESLSLMLVDHELFNQMILKNHIQYFKQAISYQHFKNLLVKCGLEDRLNEIRLKISHEFLNQLNFVMY